MFGLVVGFLPSLLVSKADSSTAVVEEGDSTSKMLKMRLQKKKWMSI
jgi:hypothetical protein